MAEHQILGGKHFLILGPESGTIWWLRKNATSSEKLPLSINPFAWRETQVDFFTIWAIFCVHWNSYQLATNWIKDRPEGLKLQSLAFATMAGPVMSSLPKNLTADVQHAIDKCESFGPGQQLILHGNPSAIAATFSPHMATFRCHLPPTCISGAACCFRARSVAIWTSLRPVVNPLPGCSSGNAVQDQLA